MGCLFSCFRFKAERRRKEKNRLKSSPAPAKNREPLLSNDQFVSVFISEGSQCGSPDFKNDIDENLERELRDEAKFLKSCGALLESPAEFWNATTLDKDRKTSNISSSLPSTVLEQIFRDEQSEDSGFQLDGSSDCCFEEHLEQPIHESSLPSVTLSSSVCLEGVNHEPGLESAPESVAMDVSPSQVDIHESSLPSVTLSSSVCLEGVNHNPGLESAQESVATDVSPSQDDIHESSLPSVTLISSACLEGVNGDPGLDYHGSCCFEEHLEQPIHESSLPSVTLSSSVCLEGVNHEPGLESAPESVATDVSPSQDDIHESSLPSVTLSSSLEGVNHDPGLESAQESVATDVSPSRLESAPKSVATDVSPSQDDIQRQPHGPRYSPYPTPLKLTDEMETPGTIYPTSQRNLRTKHVRAQYVYPVINPWEKVFQWAVPSEGCESEKIQQKSVALSSKNINDKRFPLMEMFDKENYGSVMRQRSVTPLSAYKGGKLMLNSENPQHVVTSLSHWLKPPPNNGEKNGSDFSDAVKIKDNPLERTPDGSRPILGLAGMDDKALHISPNWWGGNGIPNTTTKYKEDQKVSWHATPFEERLDKALSDNKLFPERKITNGKLVGFKDEGAESDA